MAASERTVVNMALRLYQEAPAPSILDVPPLVRVVRSIVQAAPGAAWESGLATLPRSGGSVDDYSAGSGGSSGSILQMAQHQVKMAIDQKVPAPLLAALVSGHPRSRPVASTALRAQASLFAYLLNAAYETYRQQQASASLALLSICRASSDHAPT